MFKLGFKALSLFFHFIWCDILGHSHFKPEPFELPLKPTNRRSLVPQVRHHLSTPVLALFPLVRVDPLPHFVVPLVGDDPCQLPDWLVALVRVDLQPSRLILHFPVEFRVHPVQFLEFPVSGFEPGQSSKTPFGHGDV